MIIFFHILLVVGLVWIYLHRYCSKENRYVFVVGITFKIVSGLLLSYLYLNYFEGGDSLTYFQEAKRLAEYVEASDIHSFRLLFSTENNAFDQSIFQREPRALLFSKIIYLLYNLSGGSFWLIAVYLSIFSFIGFWAFYLVMAKQDILKKDALVFALFIWPPVVFWSSGMIKESFSVGLIMMISSLVISFNYGNKNFWKLLLFSVCAYLLFKIKYYYAGVLVPLVVSYTICVFISKKSPKIQANPFLQFVVLAGCSVVLVLIGSNFHYNLRLGHLPEIIVDNYQLFVEKSMPGKYVAFDGIEANYLSFVPHLPKALFTGLFRPWLFDVTNLWSLMSAFANTILLILGLVQLKNIKKLTSGDVLLKFTALIICFVMAIFLSFSAPNFGTLVRYKAGFMPFLALMIFTGNPLLQWIKKTGKFPGSLF